ncbi:hypothetical protein D3C85_1545690 [compost metagenome]
MAAGLGLRQFRLHIGARLDAGRSCRDGRVLQFTERVLAIDLGLLQLGLHLLRAQAGGLGQGGRIVQFAKGVLAARLGLLQLGRDLGAALGLFNAGGLDANAGKRQG